MEVAVDQQKEQRGKGRTGTLENPERYDNVPGNVIPIVEREFDDFDSESEEFLAGKLPEDQFIGFRLKQGVYGQRQPDVQMVRVKLPFGGVKATGVGDREMSEEGLNFFTELKTVFINYSGEAGRQMIR